MKDFVVFLLVASFFLSPISSFAGSNQDVEFENRSDRAEKWFFEDLPRHVGNDFKETFWNGWHLLFLAGGVGVIAGVHAKDPAIQRAFQPERPMGKTFDDIMKIGAHPLFLGGATLTTLAITELVGAKKGAVTAGTMLEAFFLTEVITFGLQLATHRERPDGSNSRSFPSGHTSGAFALASVAEVLYGPWVGIPSFVVASLVGVSRIDSNKHVASDVLAGALLGTLMGIGTAKFHKKEFSKFFLAPTVTENSVGLSVIHPF